MLVLIALCAATGLAAATTCNESLGVAAFRLVEGATRPLLMHACTCAHKPENPVGIYCGCSAGSAGSHALCCATNPDNGESLYIAHGPDCTDWAAADEASLAHLPAVPPRNVQSDLTAAVNALLADEIVPLINSAINGLSDTVYLGISSYGSTGDSCILSFPFVGCTCWAGAGYSATLDRISGVRTLSVQSASVSSLDATANSATDIAATFAGSASTHRATMAITGSARASLSACGVSVSASATVTAVVRASASIGLSGNLATCAANPANCELGARFNLDVGSFGVRNTELSSVSLLRRRGGDSGQLH